MIKIFVAHVALLLFSSVFAQKSDLKFVHSIEEAMKEPDKIDGLLISGLSTFPEEIFKLTHLKTLTMYGCSFDFPKESSNYLKSLKKINIIDCDYFPDGLQNLKALNFIDLAQYYFQKIEKEKIQDLKLNKFTISYHEAPEIAPENWHLINFDTLEIVFFNNLSIFKDLYKNTQVSHIRILYARKISIIPDFFFLPPNLKSIDIEGCVIDIVEIKKKHNLDKLFINECEIKSIPLKKLKNIKAVQIRNTKIDNVSPEDLDKFENIEVIIDKPKSTKKKKL